MPAKKQTLTKNDFAAIKKLLEKEIGILVKDLRETHESNKQLLEENKKLVEQLQKIMLKVEKINIKAELIHETFLDVMVLVKLHNKKIKNLEKHLSFEVSQ
jgi:uncharacterized coiled-coil DUF342 family protein